jgi:hypothetical protein
VCGCGTWWPSSCFQMVLETPSRGWCYHSLVSHGKTSHNIAGGPPLLLGCTDNFVKRVEGRNSIPTYVAART